MFSIRLSDDEHAQVAAAQAKGRGPRALGPWLVWRAIGAGGGTTGPGGEVLVIPELVARTRRRRLILDLCGGSGEWSKPYRDAGYRVEVITLPRDVRTYVPPAGVWGVLAAPPCTEFSIAKNGRPRDFARGMECVNACMRVIAQASPKWWALENPAGYLSRFLGRPRDTWQPCDFGDPWTKRTCLWGSFVRPVRGPFVEPRGSAMTRSTPAARAITPPGFAAAFWRANP